MKWKKIIEIGITNTLRLNLYYYPLKIALRFPILASRHLRIRELRGVIKHQKITTASIRLGFDTVGIFDNKKDRSIWQVSEGSEIIIKDKFCLGNGFKLCVAGGRLIVGNNFELTARSTIICFEEIEFGDNCLVSWDILLMDTDFHGIYVNQTLANSNQKIKIGNDVWIGCRSTILKGSVIPTGCIVAAGSLVTKKLNQENSIYGGNPVDLIKTNIHWNR